MNAIVRKLKDVAIEEINFLITESNIRQEKDVDTEVKYYRLMLDIDGSATSPQERLKIIPIVATARIEQPDVWKFGTPLISHPLLSK